MAQRNPLVQISGQIQELPAGDTIPGATAKPLIQFWHYSGYGPSSNFANIETRSDIPCFAFDASTQEYRVYLALLPSSYGSGGLTVDIYWISASATSGNVVWQFAFDRMVVGADITSESYATAQTVTTAAAGTSGFLIQSTIAFTNSQIDSILAGEPFRCRLSRDAANGSDTMTGDAQVLGVVIREP